MTDCDDLSEPGTLLDAVGSLSPFVSLANQKGCFADVQVEKVELRLVAAELYAGHVHMIVRHSGYNPDIGELYTSTVLS